MDILYRTAPPTYRGCSPQPQQARTGFLSNLGCYLFGGGVAPGYRTKNGKNGSAGPTVSRCWWQVFPATPSYKAAPVEPSHDDVPDEPVPGSSDGGDCGCPTEDVIASEVPDAVHVWTG